MKIYYDQNSIIIRDSVPGDIEEMESKLRKEEVAEIYAAAHQDPRMCLSVSFSISSLCLTAVHEGKPFAMFGLVPDSLLGRTAQVWLLTTDDVLKVKTRFLKLSRDIIKSFLRRYSYLYNWVDARHKLSVRWLEWCGALVAPAHPFGPEDVPFHYFCLGGQ